MAGFSLACRIRVALVSSLRRMQHLAPVAQRSRGRRGCPAALCSASGSARTLCLFLAREVRVQPAQAAHKPARSGACMEACQAVFHLMPPGVDPCMPTAQAADELLVLRQCCVGRGLMARKGVMRMQSACPPKHDNDYARTSTIEGMPSYTAINKPNSQDTARALNCRRLGSQAGEDLQGLGS